MRRKLLRFQHGALRDLVDIKADEVAAVDQAVASLERQNEPDHAAWSTARVDEVTMARVTEASLALKWFVFTYEAKMAEVLCVYREVAVLRESGEVSNLAVISYDGKPGIQAIGATVPDLPPQPGSRPAFARDHESSATAR